MANELFPLYSISRLRMMSDGDGVCTLVAAAGCPLACKMCINPGTWNGKAPHMNVTPAELVDRVKIDSLYFISTGGGVTFGGGEPLIHSGFISAFRDLAPAQWQIRAESSLNVLRGCVETVVECINHFYIDIKDMNPDIYRAYTGGDNTAVYENLELLLERAGPARVTLRLPLIPGFNTEKDVDKSERILSDMGFTLFDRFEYIDKGKVT